MSRFSARRDAAIADEVHADAALLCCANGCPNRWSYDAGAGRMCTAHAAADRRYWPQITQEQQDAETQRAFDRQHAAPTPVRHVGRAERVEILQSLRRVLNRVAKPGRAWAEALRLREQQGDKLPQASRDMWRAALGQVKQFEGSDE